MIAQEAAGSIQVGQGSQGFDPRLGHGAHFSPFSRMLNPRPGRQPAAAAGPKPSRSPWSWGIALTP